MIDPSDYAEVEDGVVCPYCGHLHPQTEGFSMDDFECSKCGKIFDVKQEYTHTYFSSWPKPQPADK